uniref:glutathione peroxidase n=2 Tax=Kalmanozyma brasiliensis (strain GHG001) TaxID=1365824 RepID=V5GTH9_KALBG
MGIFGQNESELESGTVGGVRAAASDSDDNSTTGSNQDSSTETAHESSAYRGLPRSLAAYVDDEAAGWTMQGGADFEGSEEENSDRFWPDRVGGAYSRPLVSSNAGRRRGKAHLKRRRGRPSDESTSGANSSSKDSRSHGDIKVARAELAEPSDQATLRHLDSGWSTEDSTASTTLQRANGREALVDAVRRRRAAQAHSAASTASDADTDIDSQRRAIEAKHSLALSSRTGVNGEPLIQSVATLHSELVEVLECQLCYLLLYDPLTTPCGHTFCKSCFARSLDHGDRCPLCRADMPNFSFFQDHRPNTALLKILTSDTATFSDDDGIDSDSTQEAKMTATSTYAGISIALGSDEGADASMGGGRRAGLIVDDDPESAPHHYGFKRLYEQRKTAIEQEEREARLSTPIFVCTLAFPGMPTILHIFEPRYRLMVRRCLESGNPRFGMVLPSRNNGGTEEYGTMLEIKSVQMLADGRSMLETVGSYRFRLLEKGSLDGYTVGRVERVDDISLEEEAELERAVLVRRTELERKKAAEAVERPRACPMAPSSSAPVRTQPSSEEGQPASDAVSARPDMPRAESDALSIYRNSSSADTRSEQQSEAQPMQASGTTASRSSAERVEHDNDDDNADEAGLLPFKPVPAEPSIEELTDICTTFIETLRSGSAPWLLSRLNHTYGPMPSADEVERLGYWMALVMPIDEHEKAKLLPIRSSALSIASSVLGSKPAWTQLDDSRKMAAKQAAEKLISEHLVAVFSKSYCPYCSQAKSVIDKLGLDKSKVGILELDTMGSEGSDIQAYLQEKTSQRTVPNIFINQKHLGGCSDLLDAQKSGKLQQLVK